VERLQDMLVLQGRTLPAGALTFDQLFEYWRQRAERSIAAQKDAIALREILASRASVGGFVSLELACGDGSWPVFSTAFPARNLSGFMRKISRVVVAGCSAGAKNTEKSIGLQPRF